MDFSPQKQTIMRTLYRKRVKTIYLHLFSMNNMDFSNNSQRKTTIKITEKYKHIHYMRIHDILELKRNMTTVPGNALL
jgi:hypothetical protein